MVVAFAIASLKNENKTDFVSFLLAFFSFCVHLDEKQQKKINKSTIMASLNESYIIDNQSVIELDENVIINDNDNHMINIEMIVINKQINKQLFFRKLEY